MYQSALCRRADFFSVRRVLIPRLVAETLDNALLSDDQRATIVDGVHTWKRLHRWRPRSCRPGWRAPLPDHYPVTPVVEGLRQIRVWGEVSYSTGRFLFILTFVFLNNLAQIRANLSTFQRLLWRLWEARPSIFNRIA